MYTERVRVPTYDNDCKICVHRRRRRISTRNFIRHLKYYNLQRTRRVSAASRLVGNCACKHVITCRLRMPTASVGHKRGGLAGEFIDYETGRFIVVLMWYGIKNAQQPPPTLRRRYHADDYYYGAGRGSVHTRPRKRRSADVYSVSEVPAGNAPHDTIFNSNRTYLNRAFKSRKQNSLFRASCIPDARVGGNRGENRKVVTPTDRKTTLRKTVHGVNGVQQKLD